MQSERRPAGGQRQLFLGMVQGNRARYENAPWAVKNSGCVWSGMADMSPQHRMEQG